MITLLNDLSRIAARAEMLGEAARTANDDRRAAHYFSAMEHADDLLRVLSLDDGEIVERAILANVRENVG